MKRLVRQLSQPGHGETVGHLLDRLTYLTVHLLITDIEEHLNDEMGNAPHLIISSGPKPRVVTAGVPSLIPLVSWGG